MGVHQRRRLPMGPRSSTLLALAILLAAGTSLAGGLVYAGEKKKNGKAEMAGAAKVTIDQAVKTASEKVSGKIIEAELEHKHNKLVWEVEVVTPENKVMEVHIDADTGAVIDVEEEKAKPVRSPKQR
jgi:predicted small secreted protein